MKTMLDFVIVDKILIDSLLIGDLIGYNDQVVEVTFIESDSTGDNYDVELMNDFGEKEMAQFAHNDFVYLYMLI